MLRNDLTTASKWERTLLCLILFVLIIPLTACGGEQVAMSEEVPARRGSTNVLGQVQEITAEVLEIPKSEVVEEADFREDLGADDDQMARLGEIFEEAFTIELTEDEIDALTTVRSAVDLIDSK